MGNLSRRRFLQNSALTGGALALSRGMKASGVPVAPARRTQLSPVGYEQVKLLVGPMREQFDRNHAFFLALNEDSLLKPFRQKAGLPAPGEDMGGWYTFYADFSPKGPFHGYVPGHSFGQYLSGLARAYAQTGSKPTQQKLQRTWKSGDRIEVEFDMPLRLDPIPYQQTGGQNVALMYGPVTLFAVGDLSAPVTKAQLLAAQRVSKSSTDWKVATARGPLTMRPFAAIGEEHYRLYQTVTT